VHSTMESPASGFPPCSITVLTGSLPWTGWWEERSPSTA
jgi:hypothetical protein